MFWELFFLNFAACSLKTCVKADKSAWQTGPREISGFQAIFGELFFLNFAALLLQERNQRISGDFWGAFFLKFRGLAVARMLFVRPFQCFFSFLCFSVFLCQSPQEKWTPPFSTNSFFSVFSRMLLVELHTRNPHRHFLGFRVESSVFVFLCQSPQEKWTPPSRRILLIHFFFSLVVCRATHTKSASKSSSTQTPTDRFFGNMFSEFSFCGLQG